MKAKEQWINEVTESLDGIRPAEANPFLYEKVLLRLQHQSAGVIAFRRQAIWRVAASVVLLAGLNFYTCIHYHRLINTSKSGQATGLAADYFSYLDNTIQF